MTVELMESKIVYFTKPGSDNTDEVLHIARQRANELGVGTILVASTTGSTAVKAVELLSGIKVIAVSHAAGFKVPGVLEFTEENRKIVDSNGGVVLTTTHAFAGVSRAMRKKFNTYAIGDIIASTLRIFGPGMKVACEITLMAADGGLVRTDEDVIAIAGSGGGADTAIVLVPVNSQDFFDLKVKEILCKPHFQYLLTSPPQSYPTKSLISWGPLIPPLLEKEKEEIY